MVERTRPLSRRAMSKKAYETTEMETLRTDEGDQYKVLNEQYYYY